MISIYFTYLLCIYFAQAIPSHPSYQVYDPSRGYIGLAFTQSSLLLDLEQWTGHRISAIPMRAASSTVLTTRNDADVMLATTLTDESALLLIERAELKLECNVDRGVRITTFNDFFALVDYPGCQLHPWTSLDTSMIAAAKRYIRQ